jgi:hypothetical protein
MTAVAPLRFAGTFLRDHRHVCALFATQDDEYRVLAPFIRDGFTNGERGITVVPDDRDNHLARLREEGIDVDATRRRRQLEVLRSRETYLRNGRFDQNAMLDFIRQALDAGRALGFPRTRLIAHAELVMGTLDGANDFIEYESRLNYLLPRYEDPLICTYDLSQISAGVAVDVLRTHPLAIIGNVLRENPFFVPPDILLMELRDRRAGRTGVA